MVAMSKIKHPAIAVQIEPAVGVIDVPRVGPFAATQSNDPGPEDPALAHPSFRLRLRLVDQRPTGRRVEPTARREGDLNNYAYLNTDYPTAEPSISDLAQRTRFSTIK